ncbi:phage portal protein [Pleomorphomonas carboxyditropha]|uniref:Phage portal protein n=1 Tax=Pleomorphomonas carboxyditropha TaxID=2023338 RepID=A0A2G9X2T3_9HYPH|nr:phage portal protein [Pleomorphomonas carboxyditropha]PIP00671.1 phage portal protein [Pleomorphomonas carboxyditropha]
MTTKVVQRAYAQRPRMMAPLLESRFMSNNISKRSLDPFRIGNDNNKREIGWTGSSAGPNAAMLRGIEQVRARSHEAIASDVYARRLLYNFVYNTVDTGIRPRSKFRDLQRLFEEWTDEADSRGQLDFYGLQQLAAASMFEGGESFTRLRSRREGDMDTVPLQLQVCEAELVPSNKSELLPNGNLVIGGIERDGTDWPVAFHMYRVHPSDVGIPTRDPAASTLLSRVPATDVVQLFNPRRPGQVRGEPWLRPILMRLRDIDRYDDAERVRKAAAAHIGTWIKPPGDPKDNDTIKDAFGDGTTFEDISIQAMEPGACPVLPPGWEVENSQPADLGGQYELYMRQQLSAIAIGVDATYEQISMDWRGTNDRTYRASMLEFSRAVRSWQWHLLVFQWCRPIWRRFVLEAVTSGRWSLPDGVTLREAMQCAWDCPVRGYINPLQEVSAYVAAISAGITSRDRAANELGNDAEEIDLENARGKARSEAAGLTYTVYNPEAGAAMLSAAAAVNAASDTTDVVDELANTEEESLQSALDKVPPPADPTNPQPEIPVEVDA